MDEESNCAMLVVQDGHNYFQVDRDRSKGDGRSYDKLNAEFFAVQESSVTIDNVRVSHRLRTKNHDIIEVEAAADIPEEVEDKTIEVQPPKICRPRSPQHLPDKCIKCAGRKRSSRLLWLHEFFIVNGNHRKKTNPLVYQALQFMLGCWDYGMYQPKLFVSIADGIKATCFARSLMMMMQTRLCMEDVLNSCV